MTNQNNSRFYQDMPTGGLSQFAIEAGLVPPVDVELVLHNLDFDPSSILEMGAGEGRVVNAFLARSTRAKVFALEVSPRLSDLLHTRFAGVDQIEVLRGDVSVAQLPSVELALWLWAGIVDFAPAEQPIVFTRLASCTQKVVVLETPADGAKTNATRHEGKWAIIERAWGKYRGYIPTTEECVGLAQQAGLTLKKIVPYSSATKRARMLYFFGKNGERNDMHNASV